MARNVGIDFNSHAFQQRLGLPDNWIYQGSRNEQLAEAGIDVEGLITAIRAAKRCTSPAADVDAHSIA